MLRRNLNEIFSIPFTDGTISFSRPRGVQLHCHLQFPIALEVSAVYVTKGQQLPWLGMPGQQ